MTEARTESLPCCRALYLGAVLGATWALFFLDTTTSTPVGMALLSWALVFSFAAPGIFLVAALRPQSSAAISILTGCGISWMGTTILDPLCKCLLPSGYSNATLLLIWAVFGISSLLLLQRRQPRSEHTRRIGTLLLASSILTVLAASLLSGSLFEADLNPDGYEFFMGTRSLQHQMLPSWPDLSGGMPISFGILSTTFAARPFDAFFIEADATSYAGIRVAGLFGVFCLLIVIAAFRRNDDAPSLRSLIGPGLGVLAVTMTIATCSGYDPISCDLASPFAIDLIALAAALSCMVGLWRGSWPLIITFGVLSILARPTPILVVSVAGVACWLTRALDMKTCLRRFGVTLALFALTIWIYQTTLQSEATESLSFLSRLRFLTLTDIGRLRFLVLPAGLISAVALVLPRKLDREGRALLITCWVVFAFFAVQSFFTLHHFLLPMFLPVLIFWRSELKNNRSLAASAMIGSLTVIVALTLYAPPTHHQLRDLSLRVAFDLPQAERDQATLDRASEVLHVITSTQEKTTESYRHALARILLMEAPSQPTDDTEILIIPITGTPPDGWAIAELKNAYIRLERTDRPIHELSVHEVPYAHPLLAIPLEHQFRHIGESRGNFDIDLRQVLPWSR